MKKLVSLVLALLLLAPFPTLAEGATAIAEPIAVTDAVVESRTYADAMENRFGITILLGDECPGAVHSDSFTIGNCSVACKNVTNL